MREWENLSAAVKEVGACEATTLLDAILTGDRGWGGLGCCVSKIKMLDKSCLQRAEQAGIERGCLGFVQ